MSDARVGELFQSSPPCLLTSGLAPSSQHTVSVRCPRAFRLGSMLQSNCTQMFLCATWLTQCVPHCTERETG